MMQLPKLGRTLYPKVSQGSGLYHDLLALTTLRINLMLLVDLGRLCTFIVGTQVLVSERFKEPIQNLQPALNLLQNEELLLGYYR